MARRSIQHPGPVGAERVDVRPVHLREVALTLQPGALQAAERALAQTPGREA